MKNNLYLFFLICSSLNYSTSLAQSPVDNLPEHVTMITGFGERPDWSHDGKKVIFVGKQFGDVFEYDVETKFVKCLTLHYQHYGYTRVNYLSNGDILLSGPIQQYDMKVKEERGRARSMSYLSILSKEMDGPPTPLGVVAAEGPAVSRNQLKIAWEVAHSQDPLRLNEGQSIMFVADIEYQNGVPRLARQRQFFDSRDMPFTLRHVETQDFVPPADEKLVATVYRKDLTTNTETFLIDVKTSEFENMSKSPDTYDEAEGVFPDGKYTTTETGPSNGRNFPMVDIYKLILDGSGKKERLTYFSEYEGYKATQSVISDDGKKMVFQLGKSGDEAGQGHGLFIMDLEKAKVSRGGAESQRKVK